MMNDGSPMVNARFYWSGILLEATGGMSLKDRFLASSELESEDPFSPKKKSQCQRAQVSTCNRRAPELCEVVRYYIHVAFYV